MLFACKESKPSRAAVDDSEMKEIVLSNDSIMYIEDWVQDVEVIPLETSDKALVGIVDGVIATDSNIIIYDWQQTHRVFIFNQDGTHRATINRRGRGPQEYMHLGHVAILPDNQTLAIRDNRGKKVLYFSLDGHFLSSAPTGFWFSKMEYIDENRVVCATYGVGKDDPGLQEYENRTDLLYFTDKAFGIIESTLPPRYKNSGMAIEPYIRKFGDKVYVNRPYSDTIYQALPNGLKAEYRVNMEQINGMANMDPDITSDNFILLSEKKAILTEYFTENDKYLLLSFITPPRGIAKTYIYSKQSGKAYVVNNTINKDDVLLLNVVQSIMTSVKDKFVTVIPAYYLLNAGYIDKKAGKLINATMQRPELAHITEESNPVVVIYSFKEGL